MLAVILAGGLSRRLGGVPKAGLRLNGQTLLARTVDSAALAMAAPGAEPLSADGSPGTGARIAVVGPVEKTRLWLTDSQRRLEVVLVQEDPPFSGPAAGIAAGIAALTPQSSADHSGEKVLVLACDMPRAGDLAKLLITEMAGYPASGGIMAVDSGRQQPLAAIYPLTALQLAVDAARFEDRLQNASVFSLLANVFIKECAVPSGLTADIDTWQDARAEGIAVEPTDAKGQ